MNKDRRNEPEYRGIVLYYTPKKEGINQVLIESTLLRAYLDRISKKYPGQLEYHVGSSVGEVTVRLKEKKSNSSILNALEELISRGGLPAAMLYQPPGEQNGFTPIRSDLISRLFERHDGTLSSTVNMRGKMKVMPKK